MIYPYVAADRAGTGTINREVSGIRPCERKV